MMPARIKGPPQLDLLVLLVLLFPAFASAFVRSPSPSIPGPSRHASLASSPSLPLSFLLELSPASSAPVTFTALHAVVGTGGGSRRRGRGGRGRGRGDDDDGRPFNMSSDENYEEFFRQREEKRTLQYDQQIEAAYYEGADKNVKFLRDDPNAWDGTPDTFTSFSRGQALGLAGSMLVGTAGVMVAQRWRLLRRYTSPSAFSHPYDPQTIRRPFSIEQLRTAVTKALTKGLSALPAAPSLPPSLPFLRGSAASFKEGEGKIILYHFWRPSK
ncbi:hypothetical protein VYU27_009148 [Nannochloropsis oceanica]